MMVSMEAYLRRGQRRVQGWLLSPAVRKAGWVLAYGGGGFLLSGAGLMGQAQPIALGLLCAVTGAPAALVCLGAILGYPFFWGQAGNQGIVWTAAGGVLTAMLAGKEDELPLMKPVIAAFFTLVTGVAFRFLLGERTSIPVAVVRMAVAMLTGMLFAQARACRDAITDWLVEGVVVLALAQAAVTPWLNLGYIAAGALAVNAAFPAAALAGLGLDLAGVTPAPMTAALCLAYFLRLAPLPQRWQRYAAPGAACAVVMVVCGAWDPTPLPGLLLGGAAAALLPARPELIHRRGETGLAQVRLELGAEVMATVQSLLLEMGPVPIDREALLEKAVHRSCDSCSARGKCEQREGLTVAVLEHPLDADCRKPGRLIPELRRAQDQMRNLRADRERQGEYRSALIQQYRFLGDFLRSLADMLPRRGEAAQVCFRAEVSARSRGKERANGDKCLAFPGPGCRYFVLLCDGMGTGLGAAQEGETAAGLVRKLLVAGFPADHALRTLNSLLALRGSAGAVTVDLAELRLDTGIAAVYKWGAAPSWVLTRRGAEKIGTATPPPGIRVSQTRETMEKLSLRRGEALILLSDGVDGEDALRRSDLTPDAPPGELAAKILEKGCADAEDDATAAVIRLRPAYLGDSIPPTG